jgi:Ni/Co efflux regulator RcnB
VPTPRFGVDQPGARPGAQRGDRPVQRPSDPSQGRWSTVQPGRGGEDRNWSGRNDDQSFYDRTWARDDWQRSRVVEAPRRVYQWRDYDRFRLQHFRFDDGRYFGRTRYRAGTFLWPRGLGVRLWLIGEWLPSTFFLDSRYMLDYWRFGLYEPPAGCRWVRVGDDALLVDNFNGEVLDVIYDLFW